MVDLQVIQSGLPTGGGTITKPESLNPGRLSSELLQNLGQRLRFNDLTLKPELDGEPMPDHMLQHFYVTLGQVGWKIEKGAARDALLYAARLNSYHPIKEYLHHLEANGDVEPADLSSLASAYLGTSDTLYDAMLRATLIGAVARVLRPGCKFDTCTVLRGAQGILKSTLWKTLASPAWFCDTPNDEKDLKLAIQTCWIYELAELETKTNNKEAGAIKALLSSSVDSFRVPYGGGIEEHPRPSIFVASCNRSDFLRDETGSRRFWVIDLPHDPDRGQQIDIAKVREDRDRIWKAALLAYRAQQAPILSPEQQLESNRRNRGFEPEHVWLAPLQRWLASSAPPSFSTDQALVGAGLREKGRCNSQDGRSADSVLRDLGCQQDQHQTRGDGGKRARLWRRASDVSDHPPPSETGQTNCSATDYMDLSQTSDDSSKSSGSSMGGAGEVGSDLSESSETTFQNRCAATGLAVSDQSAPIGHIRAGAESQGTPIEVFVKGEWQPGWRRLGKASGGVSVLCCDPSGQTMLRGRDEIRAPRPEVA